MLERKRFDVDPDKKTIYGVWVRSDFDFMNPDYIENVVLVSLQAGIRGRYFVDESSWDFKYGQIFKDKYSDPVYADDWVFRIKVSYTGEKSDETWRKEWDARIDHRLPQSGAYSCNASIFKDGDIRFSGGYFSGGGYWEENSDA